MWDNNRPQDQQTYCKIVLDIQRILRKKYSIPMKKSDQISGSTMWQRLKNDGLNDLEFRVAQQALAVPVLLAGMMTAAQEETSRFLCSSVFPLGLLASYSGSPIQLESLKSLFFPHLTLRRQLLPRPPVKF